MISLAKSGSTVTFTFDDNSTYLQNGTIEVPLNSLSLVIDESNMVTFKKSASNDIFVSANIAEFGMSKSDLESWYKNNMVGSTGGGTDTGTVQTMIDESISGKADSVSAVSSAEYDSSATTINFKNIDGDIISSIDASDFVIDGMIDNVSIETISGESYLVIDFNTASGKEDIQIPISDIFDASNYYTKAEVDAITSGKVDTSAYSAYTAATETTIGNKLDISAITSSVTSASTDNEIPTAKAVFDAMPSATTYSAGRGIDITNDAISVSLPISAGTGSNSIAEGSGTTAGGDSSHAEGSGTTASGQSSHAEGTWTTANGDYSHAEGIYSTASGNASHAEGWGAIANGQSSHAEGSGNANGVCSHAEGSNTITNNDYEHASGRFNVSSSASTTFGDSGNTLFSVGNGGWGGRHNAFEIRQNGDIYITSGGTDIKLQDNIGGGIDSGTAQTMIDESISGKVDTSAYSAYTAATETTLGNKLDASAYTPVTVSSAITSGDTNAVAGGAVFDKLAIATNIPSSGVVLTFDEEWYSTNYPAYTNRLVCDFSGVSDTNTMIYFYDSDKEWIDSISVDVKYEDGEFWYLEADGCSATTAGTVLTIEFENNGIAYVSYEGDNIDKITTVAYGPDVFWIKDTKQDKLTAGRGISINSDNNVSINLPLSGTSSNGIQEGSSYSYGFASHAEGYGSVANGYASHAEGGTNANGDYSHTEGQYTIANNKYEHASGRWNVSSSASATFGNSGNTLFSVGNGENNARHNAFEIRQNGDIYITSGNTDIKLQDNLGGGISSGEVQSMIDESISGKADTSAVTSVNDALTAHTADTTIHVTAADKTAWNAKSDFSGSYNDLLDKPTIPTVPTSNTAFTNDAGYITSDALSGYAESSAVTQEISAATSGKVDTSSVVSSVTSASTDSEIPTAKCVYDKLGGLSLVKLTQSAYDALSPNYDPNTLYIIKD